MWGGWRINGFPYRHSKESKVFSAGSWVYLHLPVADAVWPFWVQNKNLGTSVKLHHLECLQSIHSLVPKAPLMVYVTGEGNRQTQGTFTFQQHFGVETSGFSVVTSLSTQAPAAGLGSFPLSESLVDRGKSEFHCQYNPGEAQRAAVKPLWMWLVLHWLKVLVQKHPAVWNVAAQSAVWGEKKCLWQLGNTATRDSL